MPRRARGLVPRVLAAAAIVAAAALARPAPAAAHTGLRASSPRAGATVADTVSRIRLEFTTRVDPGMTSLVLTSGVDTVAVGRMVEVPGSGGRAFIFPLAGLLPPGPCTVAWHTAARDGHVVRGILHFTVTRSRPAVAGAPSTAAPSDTSAADARDEAAEDLAQWSDPSSPFPVLVRWAELMALLGMIGAAAFDLFVLRRLRAVAARGRVVDRAAYGAWHLAAAAAALSALTLLARLWLQSVALNGAADAFDGAALDALLTGTVWGAGWTLQAVATVAFFIGLMVSRAPHGRSVGWMGAAVAALLLAAVPALSGHAAAVEGWTALAFGSDWLHVLGAGAWVGTLGTLVLAGLPAAAFASDREGTVAFATMVRAFSPVALTGAALAGATGVVNSLFHLSAVPQLWETAYGRMLLVKLALLGVVAWLGFYNWRYVLPELHAPTSPARLRRSAGVELAAGVAVILATAILIALPPP
jgi:copper transport protein